MFKISKKIWITAIIIGVLIGVLYAIAIIGSVYITLHFIGKYW